MSKPVIVFKKKSEDRVEIQLRKPEQIDEKDVIRIIEIENLKEE